jgi:hypothetical protein
MMSRTPFTVMLLLCAALLSGCVARLAYSNADGFVVRQLRDYVELTQAQEAQVREIVADSLLWLGVTRGEDYARLLRELGEDLERLDAAGWERYFLLSADYLEEFASSVAPRFADMLADLSPAQREGFFEALEERNVELAREREKERGEDPAARQVERLEEQFANWLGRLSDPQREIVTRHASGLESTGEMWLAQRRTWQQALRTQLETSDRLSACDGISRLIVAPQSLWPEAYAGIIERNRERVVVLLAELSPTITEAQQQRAQRRLERYARTLEGIGELAARDWQRQCGGLDCAEPVAAVCPLPPAGT